jgi:NAD(P)-dependent dehydrogenase (short-subunit alcohol dehydrogenase family)
MSRCVVVTGASRGLGLELAKQLAKRGDSVIATARHPERAAELKALDVRVERLDVAEPSSLAAFADAVADQSIDLLINNAGKGGMRAAFEEMDWADVADFFATNSIGPMRVTQALLPSLRRGRGKTIASITSRMGSIDDNTSGGAYGYRASKAALNMLNRSLSIDLARDGFTCVVLHPGWVRTDMGGAGAPLLPPQSVEGMLSVIDGLKPSDTGKFLDYEGKPIAW